MEVWTTQNSAGWSAAGACWLQVINTAVRDLKKVSYNDWLIWDILRHKSAMTYSRLLQISGVSGVRLPEALALLEPVYASDATVKRGMASMASQGGCRRSEKMWFQPRIHVFFRSSYDVRNHSFIVWNLFFSKSLLYQRSMILVIIWIFYLKINFSFLQLVI